MYILGLDTSSAMGSVGLISDEELIGEYTLGVERTRSERVMLVIAQVLKDAGLSPSQLDGIAVTLGPGSFTGLRIGVVTAKSLAYALRKPVAGFSTLEVMAENFRYSEGLICPIIDARRGQVYSGVYRYDPRDWRLKRLREDMAVDLRELFKELEGYKERLIFCGDGALRFGSLILERFGSRAFLPSSAAMVIRGGMLAELGLKAILRGERLSDAFTLKPLYLRRSEAELRHERCGEKPSC